MMATDADGEQDDYLIAMNFGGGEFLLSLSRASFSHFPVVAAVLRKALRIFRLSLQSSSVPRC
jgi:hypothetical protein